MLDLKVTLIKYLVENKAIISKAQNNFFLLKNFINPKALKKSKSKKSCRSILN